MRAWAKEFSWPIVKEINSQLCEKGNAQHGVSESAGPRFKTLWEEKRKDPTTFWAMLQLCTKIHEGAPFLNFNGNTFSAVAIEASRQFEYPQRVLLEDAICCAICGTATELQEKNLKTISEHLAQENPPMER